MTGQFIRTHLFFQAIDALILRPGSNSPFKICNSHGVGRDSRILSQTLQANDCIDPCAQFVHLTFKALPDMSPLI